MLDGIRALATEQNWARVSAFLGTLAPSGDRAILIAAAPGLVLLIGVEIIGTLADLAVVERAIWQALLGPADEDWAGQDLSGYGCLIWVDPADPVDSDLADPAGQAGLDPAVPGFLAERIARDRALALDWLMAEVRLLPALQRARAVHALDLARDQVAAAPGRPRPPAGPRSAQLARLAELDRQLG